MEGITTNWSISLAWLHVIRCDMDALYQGVVLLTQISYTGIGIRTRIGDSSYINECGVIIHPFRNVNHGLILDMDGQFRHT